MHIQQIKLTHFKNYEEAIFDLDANVVTISGKNGIGKTNLLDAIYYCSLGKSYHTSLDKNVSLHGTDFFRIEARMKNEDNAKKVIIKCKPGHLKEISIDGQVITKLSEFIGQFPVVMITPDDVHTLLQGNEERRQFLNNIIVQYDQQYVEHLTLYNKFLKQRNALLKEAVEKSYLDVDLINIITQRMYLPAQYIHEKRKQLMHELTGVFESTYASIARNNELPKIEYNSQLDKDDFLHLSDYHMEKDKFTCRTSIGIHKDELQFTLNEKSIKDYASQGQLKSYIFALKLAQYHILRSKKTTRPLLLLDDIFDKLDADRVQHLVDLIHDDAFGQIFISDTHIGRVVNMLQANQNNAISFLELNPLTTNSKAE